MDEIIKREPTSFGGYSAPSNIRLDPAADNGSGLGSGGGGGPSPESARPTSESVRPEIDLSGLSAEERHSVPDLYGGEGNPPSTNPTGGAGTQPQATPTPGDPNLAASARRSAPLVNQPPVAGATQPTLRDAARQYGLDLSQYQDDQSAFAALVQAAQGRRQDEFYTTLGRQLAPHAQELIPIVRAKANPQPAAQTRPAYMPPEFEESWLNRVEKDATTGTWKALPGQDPAYADKVNAYADWMAKFQKNPMASVAPMIEARAEEIANRIYERRQAESESRQTVNSIIEGNAAWLYQSDPATGQRYVDAQGRYIPTANGTLYLQQVAALSQAGIKDPRTLDAYARTLVRAVQPQAPAAPAAPVAPAIQPAAPSTFGRQAVTRPNVNPNQAVHPSRQNVPGATTPDQTGLSLTERIRLDMAAAGVTDADVADSYNGIYGQ